MKRWKLWTALIGIAAVVAIAAGAFWYTLPRSNTFYTDASTIKRPLESVTPRDILWQPPMALSEIINTTDADYEPRLSWDGLTLFFVRGKAGENADIFYAQRTPSGWSEPRALDGINSEHDELGPEPSSDGGSLYFYSDRPGGVGGYDIWVAYKFDDEWLPPINLGPEVNSEFNDYGPAATPGEKVLYFASNRPQPGDATRPDPGAWPATLREQFFHRTYDLYQSTLTDRGPGPARALAALNTPYNEGAPCFSPAGDFLYFSSDRPGGAGGYDLYRSWLVRGEFEPPASLGPEVNTPAHELEPGLTNLGYVLYFSSNRSRAERGSDARDDYDLYYTTSREVFSDRELIERDRIDWAALLRVIMPNLLWALLALLLILLLAALLGDMKRRRLNLLARCVLASLMLHLLFLMLMNFWKVSASVADMIRRRGEIQIALAPPTQADSIAQQIRGDLTRIDMPEFPTFEAQRRAPQLDVLAESSEALVSVARSAIADEPPRPLERETTDAPTPAPRVDAPRVVQKPTPDDAALDLPLPSEQQRIDAAENEPKLAVANADASPLELPRIAVATSQPALPPREIAPLPRRGETRDLGDGSRSFARLTTADDATPPTQLAAPAPTVTAAAADQGPALELTLPVEAARMDAHESERESTVAQPRPQEHERPEVAASESPRATAYAAAPNAQPLRDAALDSSALATKAASVEDAAAPPVRARRAVGLQAASLDAPPELALALPDDTSREKEAEDATPRTAAAPSAVRRDARMPTVAVSKNVRLQALDPSAARPAPREFALAADVETALSDAAPRVETRKPIQPDARSRSVALPSLALPVMEQPSDGRAAERGIRVATAEVETRRMRLEPTTDSSSKTESLAALMPKRTDAERMLDRSSLLRDRADRDAALDAPRRPALLRPTDRAAPDEFALRLRVPADSADRGNRFAQRDPRRRRQILRRMGGSERTERAVALALDWLARHQSEDGGWDGLTFDDHCDRCGGQTEYDVDVALTGLSLLTFLGAGHTHLNDGPYRDNIRRALAWLMIHQESDGDLRNGETMYSHGIAAIAMAEAFGMTGDPALYDAVRRAVRFIAASSNRRGGGWRYDPGEPGDTSVLGWQVMALSSARTAGIVVPERALESARRYLRTVESRDTPGLYAYQPGEAPSLSMTAEAMFVNQLLGAGHDSSRMLTAADAIARRLPDWNSANTYAWYYTTLALFHNQGPQWPIWNKALTRVLLEQQRQSGRRRGSWDPAGEWAPVGGRVYQTAICALMLEVYYRYLPMYSLDSPVALGDAPPPRKVGVVSGRVTDALSGTPLAGAELRLDLPERDPLIIRTEADGEYELKVPEVPKFFALSASRDGFVPESANIPAEELLGGGVVQNFVLRPNTSQIIALENSPRVHHLGNDRWEGSINSQFQKHAEGRRLVMELNLTSEQVESARSAVIRLLAKGVQCPFQIRINGNLVREEVDESPQDGSFGEYEIEFAPAWLEEGTNRFQIRSMSCRGDLDDFEFVNVRLDLSLR